MNKLMLFFFSLLCFSCKSDRATSVDFPTVVIDLECEEVEKDSPAFTEFSIVNLEAIDESLLGDIAKVACHGDKIYVLSMLEPTLFIFNQSGKFQSKLVKGQGPGEVTFVSDVTVYNDTLYVLDGYRSVKAYDLNGNYINEKARFDRPYFSIAFTEEGMYLLDPNINRKSDYNLYSITSQGEEKTFLPKNEWFKDVSIATYNFMRSRHIVWPLSDTIYKVQPRSGDVIPACFVDFKGKWIDGQEYKTAVTNEDMYGGSLNKYARWLKDFMPIKGGGFFFGFKYDRDYFVKYLDGEVRLYSNLLPGLPEMKQAAVGSVNESLIYVYTPEELRKYGKEHPTSPKEELRHLYESAEDENLNPVLIFVPVN